MARLINDSGVLGDAIQVTADTVAQVPFDKIIEAIHVIQTQLGITGTTAAEAATTIEGSVNSMKAAWENLLTGIADENANLPELVEQFADSFETAMDNVMPRIVQIFGGIGDAVLEAAPIIAEQIPPMVESLLPSLLNAVASLVASVAEQIPSLLTILTDSITQFADYLTNNMDEVFDVGLEIIYNIVEGIRDALPDLLYSAAKLVTSFGVEVLDHSDEILQIGVNIVFAIIEGIANVVADFGEAALGLIARFLHIWDGNMDSFGQIGTNAVNSIINAITGGQIGVQNAAKGIYDAAMRGFSGMGGGQSSGGGAGRGGGARRSLAAHDQSYWEQVGQHYQSTGQVQGVKAVTSAVDGLSGSLDKLSTSGGKAKTQVETLADKLEKAGKALSGSTSAYQTLSDAIDEYNESGQISIGTWQDLMELAPEYQSLLTQEGGKLKINTEAYANLSAAQRLEIETLAIQNGTTVDTIQLFDKLLEKTDAVGTAFDKLKKGISGLIEGGPLEIVNNLVNAFKSGNLSSIAEALGEGIWATITPEQQNAIYNWSVQAIQTMNTAFSTDGWTGLLDAGATIAQGLADGIKNNDSIFLEAAQTVIDSLSGLANSTLSKIGISGGVEGLISIIMELGPIVLGVVAAVAAVAAGVAGVAAAFSYTVDQSKALQAQIQALTEDGQELTDELSAALEVLQPIMDQIDGMLSQLDQVTSLFSDTFKGIGIEIMETMIPIIQQILNIILPVLENLQPALEAVGDLLRTLLELFGNLVSSVLTALQPILEAIGPLLETLAEILNSIASVVSAVLSPALKALGELLNWLLQPILWVAQAINNAVEWIVSLINPLLKFLGLGTISLPDGSAINKGNAISSIGSSVGDYVTPSTSTGTSSSGTTIQKVEIYIDGAQYQDPESLAEAISIQLQNLTERKVNVFA